MRSLFENKRLITLLAALALVALTVLATSLDQVSFKEAQQFGLSKDAQSPISLKEITDAWIEIPLWKQILLWSLIGLIVMLVGLLLSPEMRKRLLVMFIRMALTAFTIYFLLENYGDRLFAFETPAAEGGLPEFAPVPSQAAPVFEPAQIPPLLAYLISFFFALLCILVIWVLYRGWKKYSMLNAKKPLNEIARIARSSLNDLYSGRDSSDVIINCYFRMSDVVADKQHLRREIAMTPQEFALRLERAGLPGDAVRRLTGLFEIVRYGDRKSGPKDVNEAVSCLNVILHYCGETI